MRKIDMAALAVLLMVSAGRAYAIHEGAATPCCSASGEFACDQANVPEDVDGEHSGCIEEEESGSCSGGTLEPDYGGPGGCLCLAGFCTVGARVPVSAEECAAAAVAACCAAESCHPVP
jgi:hypothetical protein